MKNLIITLLILSSAAWLSSCGVGYATLQNQNQNSTQVHLTEDNFRVVDKITGKSEVSYVLIFGGIDKTQLYQNAYADMINSADLESSPRALVNLVTEEHIGGFPPFHYTRTITVSAHVIEFTE